MNGTNSGCQKRKKKRLRELFIESQRGYLDKFVIKRNAAENLRLVTIRETRGTNKKGMYGNKIPGMKRNGCSLSNLTKNNFVF